ncbi:M20 family metallopeptidase [Hoeflea sp.]|uniref:M20 family metallopeptidase n=1 Tax=Hoeflea sp. TaxID=1940281 RepID=UPI003A957CE7
MSEHPPLRTEQRDALAFLQQVVSFDSVSPPGNELALARMLEARLATAGIAATIFEENAVQANLVATLRGGSPGPRLVLSGHLDTVPIGDAPWRHDPFGGVIEDGRMYGRGTADMKGGLVALLYAFMRHSQLAPSQWCGELVFAATYAEEVGALGALTMVRERQLSNFDAMIIAEPTSGRLVIEHKGVLWLRITCFGKTAHGSMPEAGINAVEKLNLFYQHLKAMPIGKSSSALLSDPTCVVTSFNGGKSCNVIPDRSQLTIDIRTVPGQSHSDIISKIEAITAKIVAEDEGVRFEVETILDLTGVSTKDSARIVADCRSVLSEKTPDGDAVHGAQYFTDGSAFTEIGGDIVILGPGDPQQAHQTDEHLSIDAYLGAIDTYSQIIQRFLSKP